MTAPRIEYGGRELPAPKFWTPRNPDRPTLGDLRAKFARIWLRQPLMPWQQLVSDVSGELGDDGTPYYDLVVCTLQRQGGKTHLSMVKTGERCLSVPRWRAWYTAQTGFYARQAFLRFDDMLDRSPLRALVKTNKGNGHEVMTFRTGSTLRPHPPNEQALHGEQSDENDIDEAWAHAEDEGKALMQAIGPTQLTRPSAQTWIWSAGGTAASTWLAQLVADGRSGVEKSDGLRVAYFEWGIPDDMDLGDLEAIAEYHPAYGHTVNLNSIRKLRTLLTDDSEFARAAGNRWTEAIGGAIKSELWTQRRYADPIPEAVPVGYGAARAADGSHVVLSAAAIVGQVVVAEVLDVLPVFGAEQAIRSWLDGASVAVDPTGPSATLADKLGRAKVKVLDQTGRETSAAVDEVLDGLESGEFRFRRHDVLDAAVKVAGTRRVGDGGKAWARVKSTAPIAALEACTQAIWAVQHRPPAVPKPVTRIA